MLPSLHASIKQLIYFRGRISPREVDVEFEPPTRAYLDRLTRPTINLFLYEISENTELRRNEFRTTRGNGFSERRLAPRRIDLRYLVTVLTTELEDEHQLLWRTLATLMRFHEIPTDILPVRIRDIETPVTTRAARADDNARIHDLWSSLGIEPRSALSYVITAPLDLDVVLRSPLVLTRSAQYIRTTEDVPAETGHHIGGTVRGRRGQPVEGITIGIDGSAVVSTTTPDGRFLLPNVQEGVVTLRITALDGTSHTVMVDVPGDGYDIDIE